MTKSTCDKCGCNLEPYKPLNVCLMNSNKDNTLTFNTLCPMCAVVFMAWILEGK